MLNILKDSFGICKLEEKSEIPLWVYNSNFFSITRTSEELSIICQENKIPASVPAEKNWRCLQVEGSLNFGLIGVIAEISRILANQKIGIFVLSTYNTDYIFVKEDELENAVKALLEADYVVKK
ncbi:MAG: ACT domain-containing protein [Methanosarcina sp.]